MTQDSIQAIRFYLRKEKRGKVNSLFFKKITKGMHPLRKEWVPNFEGLTLWPPSGLSNSPSSHYPN
jgi:hypothetical protein